LGGQEFQRMAAGYIEGTPPTHFSLDRYPHGFASYIALEQEDLFASEIALLEGAIAEVFLAAESAALNPAEIAPEALGEIVLKPRAASRMLRFAYPVNGWFNAKRAGEEPEKPALGPSFLYLYRHQHEVRRAELTEAGFATLAHLVNGVPVGVALESVV